MKKLNYILLFCLVGLFSCELDEQIDPNNPSVDGVLANASQAQLNNLAFGTLSQMRPELNTYFDVTGVIGREVYRFSGSDPRWVSDLLSGTLDNNAFYTTRNWGDRYQAVKNANLLIEAANNSTLITADQLQGYLGFAKTIIAHEFITILHQQYTSMRIDVVDPENLGPLVSREAVFTYVSGILDEGQTHLAAAGDDLPFAITSGFAGFETPATLTQFNRGLQARTAMNQGNYSGVLSALSGSFMDAAGAMTMGVYYSYSSGAGDQLNPVFLPLNNAGENRLAHPSFVTDIRAGDSRINKVTVRDEPVTETGLTGTFDVSLYSTNTASIAMMKNEELILMSAEAKIQTADFGGAVTDLDLVRNAYGLGNYAGGMDAASLTDELLYQRRYSLFYEGHRWNDLIRLGRTGDLPLDRSGDKVHTVFPVPFDDDF